VASRLYRLGRLSYRRRWIVLALWARPHGRRLRCRSPVRHVLDAFSIPGTESQEALDALADRFPALVSPNASANVVMGAPKGETLETPERRAAVAAVLEQVREVPDVTYITDPFTSGGLSSDGRIAQATATYDQELLGVEPEGREALLDTAGPAEDAGLQVEFSGPAAQQTQQEGGGGELVGVAAGRRGPAVHVRLGDRRRPAADHRHRGRRHRPVRHHRAHRLRRAELPPRGPRPHARPRGRHRLRLFITSRYRHELLDGHAGEDAAGRATATAGGAVVFAGLTVVIALAGLLIVTSPS
jgi:RND superfamily putative drug exporter